MIDCSKCLKRGSCCGIFMMDKEWVMKHKFKMQVVPNKIIGGEDNSKHIAFLQNDLLCVFLNRETKMCAVYDNRPQVCKDYGLVKDENLQCPYFKPSGNRRSEASQKKVERHFDKLVNKILKCGGKNL